jgi:KipI family sensor histidine kinase inhibitor
VGEVRVRAAGDAAVMVDVGDGIDLGVNRRVHGIAREVERLLSGFSPVEVTPAYASLLVSYDPQIVDHSTVVEAIQRAARVEAPAPFVARRFTLPVCYGAEFGPDLAEVAGYHGISADEVVARHAGRDYPIFCLGFSPGFPFLGDLDPELATPRLDTPRTLVPRGSVAIGGSQTGVYPTATPGGWRLIGRTPLPLFDVGRTPPVAYRPGDMIRFRPMSIDEFERLSSRPGLPVGEPLQSGRHEAGG